MPEEIIIRQYLKDDRDYVRQIAWDTSFIGNPADPIFEDKDVLTDFLTAYFTDCEPESCFVAESGKKVIGYLIGTKYVPVLERVFKTKIFPSLLIKSIVNKTLFKKENIILIYHLILSFLKGEFKMPDLCRDYPATLHINLEPGFRHLGIGSRLMSKYLEYLIQRKVPGVYLATMSEKAGEFFKKQGFSLLHEGRRSYFRFILKKDVPIYIYGRRLV